MRRGPVVPEVPETTSEEDRRTIEAITEGALLETLRRVLLATAALALAGAVSAAFTIRGKRRNHRSASRPEIARGR
jgi:hypothetical protein